MATPPFTNNEMVGETAPDRDPGEVEGEVPAEVLLEERDEIDVVQYAALDREDAREGAAALIDKRSARFPRLGER